MRFEPRRAFAGSKRWHERRPPNLPSEIAFLEIYVDLPEALRRAAHRASRDGVCAARSLIAYGDVSESLYYRCLARHLGATLIDGWPHLTGVFDPAEALRRGRVKQADGTWLLAPTDGDIKRLLDAKASPKTIGFVLTTPAHFAAIIQLRCRDRLAYAASHQLADAMPHLSAKDAFGVRAKTVVIAISVLASFGCWLDMKGVMASVGFVFFAAMSFRLLICAFGLDQGAERPARLEDRDMPIYSVLVPLYHEAHMVRGLLAALDRLRYPREKLEILILIEADDHATRDALSDVDLPSVARVVTVPNGSPRTKPRALNAGLYIARGQHVTVYDAEDQPSPNQLRLAASIFAQSPPTLACLQARLRIDDDKRLIARLFAVEYATLFDLFNVGIARLGLPLALGGTSNHFRADVLRAIGGWDAWNVTEDADLGLRLARFGYETNIMSSVTREEAPGRLAIWMKQRRRWTKGWMQTFLVLARDRRAIRDLGPRKTLIVILMLSNLVIGPLLSPFFAILVLLDLVTYGTPSPQDAVAVAEATLSFSVIAIGIASTLWCGYQGLRISGRRMPFHTLLWLLPYQLLISAAAWGSLYDLFRDPYHWHKTDHETPVPSRSPR